MRVLDVTSLNKIYYRRAQPSIHAVRDLNLTLSGGQIFGLLGGNGAGKTTTIKMLCSLVQPTSGTIHLYGHDLAHEKGAALRHVGAVLEGTRNVYWRLSAWQNLVYFGRMKGVGRRQIEVRAHDLLARMNLLERRNDEVGKFSRGMQQKVALACALIAEPPLLLLDEPTLGLDVQASRSIKELLVTLAHEHNQTIILTTHQLEVAQDICDRIAVLKQGQLVADHPTAGLLKLFQQEYYEIRVRGRLPDAYQASFDHLKVTCEGEETRLTGVIADQAALYDILNHMRSFGLPLIAVNRAAPDLEDIFIRLSE